MFSFPVHFKCRPANLPVFLSLSTKTTAQMFTLRNIEHVGRLPLTWHQSPSYQSNWWLANFGPMLLYLCDWGAAACRSTCSPLIDGHRSRAPHTPLPPAHTRSFARSPHCSARRVGIAERRPILGIESKTTSFAPHYFKPLFSSLGRDGGCCENSASAAVFHFIAITSKTSFSTCCPPAYFI